MMKTTSITLLAIILVACAESPHPPKVETQTITESLNISELTTAKTLVNTSKSPFAKLQAVGFNEVKLTNGFWADRVNTCVNTMIPEMWRIYSDSAVSHALENFKIAAGVNPGKHRGAPFHDGDFYKMIEAASMAYAITGDEKFNTMIDEVIPLIKASQRADGYIHTPVMIQTRNNPETAQEFRDRMDFESYNMGHLMTAATVHYKATGKTELLEIARKAADYLYTYTDKFPEKMAQNAICPSHYMGVVEMYRTTGEKRYLELAKRFIDIRSLMKDGTDHNQDRIPFREQTKAMGHAVRANYLYAGVADVYTETGDETLKTTLDKIWTDLVTTKLYITGGCGALYDGVSPNGTTYDQPSIQQVHQAYGREYELPNASAHNETCANIGSVLWNWRMLQATGEARYADLLERTMYNSVLSGVNLDGLGYFYTNPLSNQMGIPYELRWPNVREGYISFSNCCPPNTIRTIAEIGSYFYSKNDTGLWLNLYGSNELNTTIGNEVLQLTQTTAYPWAGKVEIKIRKAPEKETILNFRIPDWCQSAVLMLNGQMIQTTKQSGIYLSLVHQFKEDDVILLDLQMEPQLVVSNPLVESNINQVAVQRGPLVYCLEANDLKPGEKLADVVIPADIALRSGSIKIANAELVTLEGEAILAPSDWKGSLYQTMSKETSKTSVRLIPHFAWANREEADMSVWLPLSRQ